MIQVTFYILSLILFFTITLMYLRDGMEGFNNKINVTEIMNGQAFKVLSNGKELKLSKKCPHQGCNVDWDQKEGKFICPCHQSTFDHQGNLLKGPATTGLKKL